MTNYKIKDCKYRRLSYGNIYSCTNCVMEDMYGNIIDTCGYDTNCNSDLCKGFENGENHD